MRFKRSLFQSIYKTKLEFKVEFQQYMRSIQEQMITKMSQDICHLLLNHLNVLKWQNKTRKLILLTLLGNLYPQFYKKLGFQIHKRHRSSQQEDRTEE